MQAKGEAVQRLEKESEHKGEMLAQAAAAARAQAERWDAQTAARQAAQQHETATRLAEARLSKASSAETPVTYFTPALY